MSALPINSVDVNFAGIFAEVEQLKAMGGDEMVKTKLFPRFEEAGIILYPGMFSEERGLVKVKPCSIPHSQSPQPASKLQQCSPLQQMVNVSENWFINSNKIVSHDSATTI